MTGPGQKLKDGKKFPNLNSEEELGRRQQRITLLQRLKLFFKIHWRGFVLVSIPIILLPLLIVETTEVKACRALYILLLMACFWTTEVLPIAITSMIPIAYFPVAGIMSTEQACALYLRDVVVMYLGAIMMATSIEYCNLHERLALKVIKTVGCSPRRLHFSLVLVTSFISLWMSNAPTTALVCPIIKAVLEQLEMQGICKLIRSDIKVEVNEAPYPSNIKICFYMSTAYAATMGGSGTLIGTPTNLALQGIYDGKFPNAKDRITFATFMLYSMPSMILYTLLMGLYMQWAYLGAFRPKSQEAKAINYSKDAIANVEKVVNERYNQLGPMSCHEISIISLHILMIVLYFTIHPAWIAGWDSLFESEVHNATSTLFILFICFCLPVNYDFLTRFISGSEVPDKPSNALLSWKFLQEKVSWGLIFLIGGGFVLAKGVEESKLLTHIADILDAVEVFPPFAVLFLVIVIVQCATQICANVVVCNIVLPILIETSLSLEIHPLYLALPAGLACSMAFHLPTSTAPNALVASYANIRTKDMMICGIGPSLITLIVLFVVCPTWGSVIFPNLQDGLPEWINATTI